LSPYALSRSRSHAREPVGSHFPLFRIRSWSAFSQPARDDAFLPDARERQRQSLCEEV
jgi:hypothetical protein